MHPEWQLFLETAGARIEQGAVFYFGPPQKDHPAGPGDTVLADLSHLGLIAAAGADAQTFLHGQFTSEVREVSEQHHQLSAYCSPKGRVLALFRLFRRGEIYYMNLPREVLETALKRLRLFVLRAKVSLVDASDKLIHIGLAGPEAPGRLTSILGTAPQLTGDSCQIEYGAGLLTVLRTPGPCPRFEVIGEIQDLRSLWQALSGHLTKVSAEAWTALDIRGGIPNIYAATSDAFVPQMLNLQALGAVSFSKGCYPGQEIVARMHYLGTLKRRLFRACADTISAPRPGDPVYAPGETQSIGQVVEACPDPGHGFELLAVLIIASAGQARLQGVELVRRELPYSLENS